MPKVTAESITYEQIRELRNEVGPRHWVWQYTIDAETPSTSHPHRQRNARRECAAAWNARHGGDS